MASPVDSYQQYVAPEWFNEELKRVGGENRYGLPNFKICWGQGGEEDCLYRAGGYWDVENLPSYHGYRWLLRGGGTPSWCLLQWDDAIFYGTPESFYVDNYDTESDMQTLGEYPYAGAYRLLYNLCWRDMSSGKMKIEAMPLNSFILDCVIPIIIQAKDISYEKTKAALRDQKEKEDKADLDKIEDAMRDASLPFKGPTSYARQGCRTWHIDKRVEEMTRNWNRIATNAKHLGRGLSAHSTNPTV